MSKLRTLSRQQARKLVEEMEAAAASGGKAWNEWHSSASKQTAVLSFPGGEIMNPNIQGFVWGWKMRGVITIDGIRATHRMSAQGLEGLIQVNTSLVMALIAYKELPEYRRELTLVI